MNNENINDNYPDNSGVIKKGSCIKEILEYMEIFVVAVACVFLLFSFCFRICIVDGPSMENTLYNNERLLVSNVFYTPERGDIVVFHETQDPYNKLIVKRVIAVEGETVIIKHFDDTMTVSIIGADGENKGILVEEYMKYVDYPQYSGEMTVTVEEGTVFVMGDNRNHSADSRTSSIGLVDTRQIVGRVMFRIMPFSRFGSVK